MCSTIMIISKGRLVACDTPEKLEQQYTSTVSVELTVETTEQALCQMLQSVENIQPYNVISSAEDRCTVKIPVANGQEDDLCRSIFKLCSAADTAILSMNVEKLTLEDIFIQLTEPTKEEN